MLAEFSPMTGRLPPCGSWSLTLLENKSVKKSVVDLEFYQDSTFTGAVDQNYVQLLGCTKHDEAIPGPHMLTWLYRDQDQGQEKREIFKSMASSMLRAVDP